MPALMLELAPVTMPPTSDRNFTPTSAEVPSATNVGGTVVPKIVEEVAAVAFVRMNVAGVATPQTEAVTL